VVSIAVALFLIGAFALFVLHANQLKRLIQKNFEVQVFLDKNVSDSLKVNIGQYLAVSRFVDSKDGSPRVFFISKEKAAQDMMKETGENFVQFVGENPLRSSYVINIKSEYYDNQKLLQIRQELQEMPGIYEVSYVESMVNEINDNIVRAEALIAAFSVILLIVVGMLINSSIKLAMFSQRFLIRSMQLVGATSAFITRPFLFKSALHGLLGGLIADGLLVATLFYVNLRLPKLSVLQDTLLIGLSLGGLLLLGITVCVVSAKRSVNRFIRMSLDQLY